MALMLMVVVMMKLLIMLIMDSDNNIGVDENKSRGDGNDVDDSSNDEVPGNAHGDDKDDGRDVIIRLSIIDHLFIVAWLCAS